MFPSASAEILKALAFFWPSRQASFTMKAATSSAGTARCRLAVEPIWLGKPAASRINAVTCKKSDTDHYTIENFRYCPLYYRESFDTVHYTIEIFKYLHDLLRRAGQEPGTPATTSRRGRPAGRRTATPVDGGERRRRRPESGGSWPIPRARRK